MFNSDNSELFRATITKAHNKYIVADYHSNHSIEYSDILDAKAAALLIESGIGIEALTDQMVFSFKIQLIKNSKDEKKN
jgi:hypothetical protein